MSILSMIKKIDLNRNGISDIEEILGKLDFNGDGKINMDDLKFKVKELILDRYDEDEDGELSKDEIIDICIEIFTKLKKFV